MTAYAIPFNKNDMSRKIFFIEDEPELVRLLRLMLERYGYIVEGSHTLSDAREKLAQVQPDLVLLDLHLTDATQIEVLDWAKGPVGVKNIPVLFLTGDLTIKSWLDHTPAPHLKGMISKPFSYKQLLLDIDAALV
ncbi:MAG: response regulator [Planctomycetaceae bacterium]|nr:response regulator [Planctomycetaceae bacterium]